MSDKEKALVLGGGVLGIGELSLEKDRVPESERRAIIEARLAVHEWPEQLVQVTTIQADTGEFKVLDKTSGVSLVDAVAASCAIPVVWPAVTFDGARHYDGGLRSGTTTDVAEGLRQGRRRESHGAAGGLRPGRQDSRTRCAPSRADPSSLNAADRTTTSGRRRPRAVEVEPLEVRLTLCLRAA